MNLQALHKISYGLYVITSASEGRYNGQIANTLFQVTSEPPTVAVSINRNNLTWEFIDRSRVLAASVLCETTPLTFIGRFGFKSGRDTDKLTGLDYQVRETGAPVVLDNAAAWLEARVIKQLDVGTHTIFVGEVVGAEIVSDEACLTYENYHLIKGGKTPRSAPSFIADESQGDKGPAK